MVGGDLRYPDTFYPLSGGYHSAGGGGIVVPYRSRRPDLPDRIVGDAPPVPQKKDGTGIVSACAGGIAASGRPGSAKQSVCRTFLRQFDGRRHICSAGMENR